MERFIKYESEKARVALLVLADILIMHAVSLFVIMIRFEFRYSAIEARYLHTLFSYLPIYTICNLIIFWFFRLYKSLWRYASAQEIWYIIFASVTSTVVHYLGIKITGQYLPRSYWVLTPIFLSLFLIAERFTYRGLRYLNERRRMLRQKGYIKRTMIIGAGEAGRIMLKEMIHSSHLNNKVICMIDDDEAKIGKYLQGVPIVGNQASILENVRVYDIDEIIVAIPSATAKQKKEVLQICQETGCSVRILPGVYQLINGEVNAGKLREVEVEDLLGREQIEIDLAGITGYIKDKVVMVTGGGGSIGSELCRQLAAKLPKQLIIVDIYENTTYDIQQELWRDYPELDLVVLIASVRNTKRMEYIFKTYQPQIVYHAAAHKHVPLMEDSPNEAIKNNVLGTYKTAGLAGKYGVEKFVMISTDKAVNPTNIMGASKRMCEMIIQMYNRKFDTEFVAVRFGNVLGSNGSVIPLFKQQIKEGGPVTVTHPDIIRYFMTISEAVSLVLEAGAYAHGGEIFVLDMGEPVKILDLAKNLIRLSGYIPNVDIDIQFTGLRPGEKLYEELLMSEEGLQQTKNKLIFIGKPIEFDEEEFLKQLGELEEAVLEERENIKEMVEQIVPTYQPKSHDE